MVLDRRRPVEGGTSEFSRGPSAPGRRGVISRSQFLNVGGSSVDFIAIFISNFGGFFGFATL